MLTAQKIFAISSSRDKNSCRSFARLSAWCWRASFHRRKKTRYIPCLYCRIRNTRRIFGTYRNRFLCHCMCHRKCRNQVVVRHRKPCFGILVAMSRNVLCQHAFEHHCRFHPVKDCGEEGSCHCSPQRIKILQIAPNFVSTPCLSTHVLHVH